MKILVVLVFIISTFLFAQGRLELLSTLNGIMPYFGQCVAGGVDINGSGTPDVIVGSPYDGPSTQGQVFCFYGENFDTIPDLVLSGANTLDLFGSSICFCPDVNGDGYPELLVGAPNFNSGSGRVYMYFGGPGFDPNPDIIFTNPSGSFENFGYTIACGNLTGNTSPDIAVGAPNYSNGLYTIGRVYLFVDITLAGPLDTLCFTTNVNSEDYFGKTIAVGKMDGNIDTYDELLIGAPDANSFSGKAFLFYGGNPMDTIADLVWYGNPNFSEMLGQSLASIGDVNDDGKNDFAIGIPQRGEEAYGECYIIIGKSPQDTTPDYILKGDCSYGMYASSIKGIGDVNGDTKKDFMIGAKNYDNGVGKVFIYLSPVDTVFDAFAVAPDPNNNFGSSISGCGDINGDGFGDVIVGSNGGLGRTYIYKGRDDFITPIIDNVTQLFDTAFCGPFVISAYIWDLSGISRDSIYYNINESGWIASGHDSLIGNTYFFHIPEQTPPAYNPIRIQWYLMARDNSYPNVNVTYSPLSGSNDPYSFEILDRQGPNISNTTIIPDTTYLGPYRIYCNVQDISGVSNVILHYSESPNHSNILPMYPTGVPNEYSASIPSQIPNRIIAYRIEAVDSFLYPNKSYDPIDTPTHYAFCVGEVPQVLLVDNGLNDTFDIYYKASLDTLGVSYCFWPENWGKPRYAFENPDKFKILIWFTSKRTTNLLNNEDIDSLISFFNRGGKLFISSQNLGETMGNTSFYQNYLHAQFVSPNLNVIRAHAVPGDSISDIYKDTILIGGGGGANNANSKDRIRPDMYADSVYVCNDSGGCYAIKYKASGPNGYRTVYFSVPFEAIDGSALLYAQRTPIMASILRWFGMPVNIEENISTHTGLTLKLGPISPSPFSSQTKINFTIPNKSHVSLKVYDLCGRQVKILFNNDFEPGYYDTYWDGKDEKGRKVSNGVYFLVIDNSDRRITEKIIVIK